MNEKDKEARQLMIELAAENKKLELAKLEVLRLEYNVADLKIKLNGGSLYQWAVRYQRHGIAI